MKIFILANILKLCIHLNIMLSSLYKIFHIYVFLRIFIMI
jgi:hypothetical protein